MEKGVQARFRHIGSVLFDVKELISNGGEGLPSDECKQNKQPCHEQEQESQLASGDCRTVTCLSFCLRDIHVCFQKYLMRFYSACCTQY